MSSYGRRALERRAPANLRPVVGWSGVPRHAQPCQMWCAARYRRLAGRDRTQHRSQAASAPRGSSERARQRDAVSPTADLGRPELPEL